MKRIKKTVYLSFISLPLLVTAVSCEKNPEDKRTDETISVSAVLENGRVWNSGDEVVINGSKYYVDYGGESVVMIDNVSKEDAYYAAYDTGNGSINENVLSLELPSLQSPSVEMARPMVASNSRPELLFKNILGCLRLSLAGEGTVVKLSLSSFGKGISGEARVALDYTDNPSVKMGDDAGNTVTVDLGKGVTLPGDVDIWLPAALYDGFSLTVYDSEGGVMTAREVPSIEIRRGEIVTAEVGYEPDGEAPVYVNVSVEPAYDGSEFVWSASVPMYINGIPAILEGGAGTSIGEFGPVPAAETYYASTSSASANGLSGNQMRVKIPQTQAYASSIQSINPAVGMSGSRNIDMKYLAGVAEIEVKGAHIIREVVLAGKGNRRLAGNGVVDMSSDAFRMSLNADASKEIRLDCGSAGVSVENGVVFRFVLPSGDYEDGFTVSMTDSNGQVFSQDLDGCAVVRNGAVRVASVNWEGSMGDSNNLSRLGCANSYMVHLPGTYTFSTRRVDNTPVNGIAKVDWLWASKVDGASGNVLVSDISYADGEVTFTASEKEGNVLLAAFDDAGNILWSWHIWLVDAPEVIDCENNVIYQGNGLTDGYYVMDRNLGATDATVGGGYGTFGLYYQWGRKDPFIGSTKGERVRNADTGEWDVLYEPFGEPLTVVNSAYSQAVWTSAPSTKSTGTEEYAAAHPMHFMYCEDNAGQANWLGQGNFYKWVDRDDAMWRPFQKTNSDPCPPGYMVPRNGMWDNVQYSCVYTPYKGILYTNSAGKEVWYPFAGYRSAHPSDQGALLNIETELGTAAVWSSELMVSERSYSLKMIWPLVNPSGDASWGYGYNVRCVVEYND